MSWKIFHCLRSRRSFGCGRDWSWFLAASDWILRIFRIPSLFLQRCLLVCCQLHSIHLSSNLATFTNSLEDKEMISKLVAEMPGGFEAMNGYLRRNIAEALRTMQAAIWDGWILPLETCTGWFAVMQCLKFLEASSTFLRFEVFWQMFLSQHQQSL